MTLEKLKSDAGRYQIVSSYVDNEVRSQIGLDASAARKYYDENIEYFKQEETVRASHILVQTSENAEKKELDEALAKIVDIREKIVGGESFESLAMEYSDCPSGANGGDLGEFGHGQMVPPFDRAVFALEPGELSQPVQTQFGFHLIKLVEKNEGQTIAYTDVEPQIVEYLVDQKVQAKINEIVEKLRDKAVVKLF